MFRLTSFLKRRPEFSHPEFLEYWWREHSPIAAELSGLLKYSTTRPLTPASTPYDGVAELYFEDRAAFDRVLGPDAETAAIEDVPRFIDDTSRYHLREKVHVSDVDTVREELKEGTPVPDQTQFPVSEFVVFRKRDDVFETAFDDALAAAIERQKGKSDVAWLASATPVEEEAEYDVLLKRTVSGVENAEESSSREGSPPTRQSPADEYGPVQDLAESTLEFVGYERTVVDELP
ncbi:MAG: EthD family reductase [Haloferacaceae archaeon]